MSSETELIINVNDSDDLGPKFTERKYKTTIQEDFPIKVKQSSSSAWNIQSTSARFTYLPPFDIFFAVYHNFQMASFHSDCIL